LAAIENKRIKAKKTDFIIQSDCEMFDNRSAYSSDSANFISL